jgi:hypothetical protein
MLFISILKHMVTFFVEMVLNIISLVLFQRHLANKARLVHRPSGHTRPESTTANRTNQTAENSRDSPGGRKMANLVLFKSVTGFVHHSFLLALVMYSIFNSNPGLTTKTLIFSSYFASTVRHALNFAQFYMFNTAFRNEARVVLAQIKLINNANTVSVANINNSRLTR